MKLLLDTHIYLWWLSDHPKLGERARDAVASPAVTVFISPISIWEIAIKSSIGKLEVEGDPLNEIQSNGFEELAVKGLHAQVAGSLPAHHADPFDRMLIAQAQTEHLVLATRDAAFAQYDVALMSA